MASNRRYEGFLQIDHRNTPGLPEHLLYADKNNPLPKEAGRGLFESATLTCSHCQRVFLVNPMRTRERAFCTGCDHYLCDGCGAIRAKNGGLCRTFKQIIEEAQEAAARNLPIVIP